MGSGQPKVKNLNRVQMRDDLTNHKSLSQKSRIDRLRDSTTLASKHPEGVWAIKVQIKLA